MHRISWRHSCTASWIGFLISITCTCAQLQQSLEAGVLATKSTSRPQIRIAQIADDLIDRTLPTRLMMEHLLGIPNRTLLPDYDIIIDFFTFEAASGKALVELIAALGSDTPSYHAVVGPFSRQDAFDVVDPAAQAPILHIHAGDQPDLSDKSRYPYNFRARHSAKGMQMAIFYIASILEWRSVVSIWPAQALYDSAVEAASRANVTNYATLARDSIATWAVEAWQADVVASVRIDRLRVLIVQVRAAVGYQLICRLHRSKLSGLQFFVDASWAPTWYLQGDYSPLLGNCTVDEIYTAAMYHIQLSHAVVAPGVNFMNKVLYPPLGGDQSQIPLTCMPDLTAQAFYNPAAHESVHGNRNLFAAVSEYWNAASAVVDGVCATLVALHDAIYEKGITVRMIEQRDIPSFLELVNSMKQVDLQGPSGTFRFYNNTGDPEYGHYLLRQWAVPGRQNGSLDILAVVLFPDGPDADPRVSILYEEQHPLMWRDRSTGLGPKPELGIFSDCGLVNGELIWDSCKPCEPGTAYDKLLRECRVCQQGLFQNMSGQDSCQVAPPGWYVLDTNRPSAIAMCPPGYNCPQVGTVLPQPCAEGTFAASPGAITCELCPTGKYQNSTGATACTSCQGILDGGITATIASKSPSACICREGTYRPLAAVYCSPCLEGMECPEGSDMLNLRSSYSSMTTLSSSGDDVASGVVAAAGADVGLATAPPYPRARYGYMTLASAPLTVYRCGDESHCPGGPPGSCSSRRDVATVACGECVSGAYEAGEKCLSCGAAGALPFLSIVAAGMVLVIVATIVINKDIHNTPMASMMIVAVMSLLFTSLQTMGVFSTMEVPWQEPVKSILEVTRILSFDLDVLKMACVVGGDPIQSFALRQLLAVLIIPFVLCTLFLKKYATKWRRPKTNITVELCNSIGLFYSIFFISIVTSAMDPFICYEHPNGSGESMTSAPSLLCFQGGNHTVMIVIGIVAMVLVPGSFWCFCLYAILMYPRRIKLQNSGIFLHATRFLFFRFAPQRYYFQLVVLLRSLLVCTIPAILRGRPAAQVLFTCVVLGIYIVILDSLRPWRVPHCNFLESMMCLLLLVLLLCGAVFLDDQPQQEAIAVLGGIMVACIFASAGVALAYALWQRFAPSRFHFFICYHMSHASAQARYLKILLSQRKQKVFIDSDSMEEMDALLDVVRNRVRHFVILLTAETLKRPWCIGELVTAFKAKIPVTQLRTPSFEAPTDEQCLCPHCLVDTTSCSLSEHGIQWSDITTALLFLVSPEAELLHLNPSLLGTRRFQNLATGLLRASTPRSAAATTAPSLSQVGAGGVLVVTDPGSDEASAAGGILIDQIGADVYCACEQGICLLCDCVHDFDTTIQAVRQASVVVVILSPGCLSSLMSVCAMCELMWLQERNPNAPVAISVNVPGFSFPSSATIERQCKALPPIQKAFAFVASDYMSMFFKRISILLPTDAKQEALTVQLDEVFSRIKQALTGSKLRSFSSGGGSSTVTIAI